jgi:S1-C subfamily serine protease
MSNVKRFVAVALVAMIALFAFYVGTQTIATQARADVVDFPSAAPEQQVLPSDANADEQLYAQIYDQIAPSVVSINVIARVGGEAALDGFNDGLAEGTGTGFIVDNQGHIVTNNHVVDGAVQIEVNFFDGRIVRGEVVGLDPDSDLAVVKVDVPAETLQPIALADSDELFVGQSVVAIGSPFGQSWTMTTGIISALNRTIQGLGDFSIGSVIQTDAAINPGNSGGPLVNLQGEVIGVNAQIISQTRSNTGIGFAIPVNLVKRVYPSLIETGDVDYSYLGISGGRVTLAQIEALGLPNDAQGVVVNTVEPSGPAAQGGLRAASGERDIDGIPAFMSVDIITAIDGTPVRGMPDLVAYLAANTAPGQTVNLTVIRDGRETLTIPVTLASRPGQ